MTTLTRLPLFFYFDLLEIAIRIFLFCIRLDELVELGEFN